MNEKEKELNEVLEELAKNLDITDTEDAAIRESYNAVGEFLAKEGTLLDKYEVEIFPQGSFNLGTIYNPQNEMLAFCKTKCSIRKTKRILLRVPS